MHRIEHVVLLMLENRSFDSLLGWLYEDPAKPSNTLNLRAGERPFDGLSGIDMSAFINEAPGRNGGPGLSSPPIRGASGLNVPQTNPGETFEHVNIQLFEKHPVGKDDSPTMKGYLRDYVSILDDQFAEFDRDLFGRMIMESYTRTQLPVINGLAEHYAVCDRWFSSVPSQTNANRAFSLCGTSLGLVDNGYKEQDPRRLEIENALLAKVGDDRFDAPTLWNSLYDGGYRTTADWMVFWQGPMLQNEVHRHLAELRKLEKLSREGTQYLDELTSDRVESCYTYRIFPRLAAIDGVKDHFAKVDEFKVRARAGRLPKFSYIEPLWTLERVAIAEGGLDRYAQPGNDYHPPGNNLVAEEFLKQIYSSLISNEEAWRKTLFIVTFDEGVGQFDHVKPVRAKRPWRDDESTPELQYGFGFDRYGSRVPTLLISPYIRKGTVFRATGEQPYDHTSLIATVLKWLGLGKKITEFGERAKSAPTFEDVITLREPRSDAREIGFLRSDRKIGDPVQYFDRFQLCGSRGKFLSHAEHRAKRSPPSVPASNAYFPTLGTSGVALHIERAGARMSTAAIGSGDVVKIVTADLRVGACNVLMGWTDSADCCYLDDCLSGEKDQAQQWVISTVDGASPIRFGDEVVFESVGFPGNFLVEDEDGKFLRRSPGPARRWTILPPPASAA